MNINEKKNVVKELLEKGKEKGSLTYNEIKYNIHSTEYFLAS